MSGLLPSRRWFRFSLRTLFVVVTAICVYLGHQWNWMNQRQEFLAAHQFPITVVGNGVTPVRAPQLLPWLGEAGRSFLLLEVSSPAPEDFSRDDRQMLKQAVKLFPETSRIVPLSYGPQLLEDRRTLTASDIRALSPEPDER